MKVFNATQHAATQDQIDANVVDLTAEDRKVLSTLLTFDDIPSKDELATRALQVTALLKQLGAEAAMIGSAPFFMGVLEHTLKSVGIVPMYAFSRRESVEVTEPDGSVRKTNVFKHIGFVEV